MITHVDALVASDYVVCATLRKVPDVFNVEMIWERVRGSQDGVFLMEALKRHPRTPRDRHRKETRYSHVLVRLPERDYVRDDRLEDGFGRRTLMQELRRLHEQELSRYLAENATIRYRIEPDAVLRSGEVQFLFGRAIYLPTDGETPIFRIQATSEGESDWRAVGMIYPGQRLTLLNGDRRASTFAVVGWPFFGGESVLLVLRSETPAQVDVVAEPPDSLTLQDSGDGSFTLRDRRGRGLRLRVTVAEAETAVLWKAAAAPTPEAPVLERESVPVVATPEAVLESKPGVTPPAENYPVTDHWGRREPVLGIPVGFEASPEAVLTPDGPTPPPALPQAPQAPAALEPPPASPSVLTAPESGLDQHTWIPRQPLLYLRVTGVALQRLSTYAAAGISDWRICFNRAGELVAGGHPDAAAWLRIDSADRLFGEVVGLSAPLGLPGVWRPFPELELELCAASPPMTMHYLGWVRLPAPLTLPVPRGRAVSFGRGSEADIAPRLLADPRSLRWGGDDAKAVGINAEYLGLSRRHLQLQARRDDWWVQLESQNMPVYRLAPSGDLLDVLNPGVNTATAAKPGELLVAGGYVLALGIVA